jgi:PASTA domain-containing protein
MTTGRSGRGEPVAGVEGPPPAARGTRWNGLERHPGVRRHRRRSGGCPLPGRNGRTVPHTHTNGLARNGRGTITWKGEFVRTTYRLLLLTVAGMLASTVIAGPAWAAVAGAADPAGRQAAAPQRGPAAPVAGSGSAAPQFVNLRQAAQRPDARTPHRPAAGSGGRTGALRRPLAHAPAAGATRTPSAAPTAGTGDTRGTAKAAGTALAGPRLASSPTSALVSNFDGITEDTSTCACQPSDVNAATSGPQVVEIVNTFLQVYGSGGGALCTGTSLNAFLGSTDDLGDPRVQYDNVNGVFLLSVAVFPTSSSAAPALYLGASTTGDACGSWIIYRLTFSGGPFTPGTTLDYPVLGQDRRAFLFGTTLFAFGGLSPSGFSVFAVSKADVFRGAAVSFPAFNVASASAPVSNGGTPMIDSTASYFLGSVPGTGYRLYQMLGSGSSSPSVSLLSTVGSSFVAPQPAPQPGTTVRLDALDGRIEWSPVYDGTRIWFANGAGLTGFPTTVRFGFVTPANGGIVVGQAFHNSGTADFNPSIGVGTNPDGTETVFVNWAYTDAARGIATSAAVKSFSYSGGGLPSRLGDDETLVSGGTTTLESRFGDYSSVAVDPTVADGSCALVAQQYFVNELWSTRLARVCGPTPVNTTVVPNVLSLPESDATSLITAAGLVVGTVSKDFRCIDPGNVLVQNPSGGVVVLLGSTVNITVSQSTDKNGKPCVIK